ncbi:MAG: hypothetical protein JWM43_3408 [Acidobacteriaceae bacterium]|nr:hypothetical protein [Acidobacteriaceae bacterium]
MPTSTQLVTGLAGAVGCDFRTAQNQLVFVEFGGKLSTLDLFPAATIVAQAPSTILKGTFLFDFDSGVQGGLSPNADVFWEQMTATARQMTPRNTARIVNLGPVDFNSLTAETLRSLTYGTAPIPGSTDASNKLVPGDIFAVHTTSGNYAKVKVLNYGYNLTIQWITYNIPSGYHVIGTGYNQPEDVKVSTDGVHAYITERSGDLVKVVLTPSSSNRSTATVVASGITAPQQFFLDEAHNAAYVVEYAATGRLLKINLTTGAPTLIATLNFPVGVVLSSDLQYAYVTEQTTGPDTGRVSSIQISSGARTTIVKNLVSPFFLTWADTTQDALLIPLRDPSNSIISVNISLDTSNLVAAGVPVRPSSVALANPGLMLICSDSVIESVAFTSFPAGGPLLMGIGFIPFDKILQSPPGPLVGTATTDPGYFFQVHNAPFAGTLPVMVNYQSALDAGASYYQVKIDGVPHTDSFSDYLWNGAHYVLQTTTPHTVGPSAGCYPVRPLGQLFLWMNPSLGDLLNTTGLTNGLHTLTLQFLNAAGTPTVAAPALILDINNQPSVASLSLPLVGGAPADACGVFHYGANTAAVLSIAFTASHPANLANYSFSMVRGVTSVVLPPPTSGPVSPAPGPITSTVATLLGPCPTAGFAVELYVAVTMTNGWGRQSQYDASSLLAFVLTP